MSKENDSTPDKRLITNALNALKDGTPIYIDRLLANGDFFLQVSAYKYVLEKFAKIHEIDLVNQLPIHTDVYKTSMQGTLYIPEDIPYYNKSTILTPHFLHKRMMGLAQALDVRLGPDDFNYVPSPFTMDHGPLKNYNQEDTMSISQDIRHLAKKKKIITVVVAGERPLKKLSDGQAAELADFSRTHLQDVFIIIITNKKYLRETISTNGLFPRDDPEFKKELASSETLKSHADLVVDISRINQLCGILHASDTIITTDGYWSHLGGGMQAMKQGGFIRPEQLITLYTLFSPAVWKTPGSTVVESEALYKILEYDSDVREYQYYQHFNRGNLSNHSQTLIDKKDIHRVKQALVSLPSHRKKR